MIDTKQILVDDIVINYHIAKGKSSSTPIILLHGWRSEGRAWYQIIENLSKTGFTCYALDLPGFGKSQAFQKDAYLKDYAFLINQFVSKLGIKKAHLIGHSFGGRISIKITAKNEPWVDKLILVDSAGIKTKSFKKSLIQFIAKIVKPLFTLPLLKSLRPKLYKIIGAEDYIATPHLKNIFLNIIDEDLEPLLSKIKNKSFIIWGEDDEATPVSLATTMKKKIPNSNMIILKEAGHFSFIDQPTKFTEIVLEFLN